MYTTTGFAVVNNASATQELQETQVRSLGQEDPLEEGMATHSSFPAWRIPRTEGPGGATYTTERLNHHHQDLLPLSPCVRSDHLLAKLILPKRPVGSLA